MASSANPDPWSDLSNLASSDGGNADARTALLKVNAQMFVAAPARDRESIETFEALVLGFLPRTDAATRCELARILAPCPDTPASILDYIARHSHDARDATRQHAALPSPGPGRRLLATAAGRLHLASQSDLDPDILQDLLVLGEDAAEDALAANPAFPSTHPAFGKLLRRAHHRPALGRILLDRTDLAVTDEAALYLMANDERRRAIRERLGTLLAHRRVNMSFTLSEPDIGGLVAAGLMGDLGQLESQLTALFGFPAATEWRVLEIGRHRLLALALTALGMTRKDAIRIFLTLHPALSSPLSAIRGLLREMRDVPAPVALVLVESILGAKTLSGEALA